MSSVEIIDQIRAMPSAERREIIEKIWDEFADRELELTPKQAAELDLGLEFKSAVDGLLALVAQQPMLFRQVRGPVRRAVLKRFPYTIHFLDEPGRIVVLAVFHAARDPGELRQRHPI